MGFNSAFKGLIHIRPFTFNKTHAPTTSRNITSIHIALSGIDKGRCNCLFYLSNATG